MPSEFRPSRDVSAAARRRTDSFEPRVKTPEPKWDDDEPDPEATTYTAADHGPDPVPDWVITTDLARQTELGLLKTGKEAEVFMVERRFGEDVNLLAAKRYKDMADRMFRNDSRYRQGKKTGNRRVDLAVAKGTRTGMAYRAELWLDTEFTVLGRLWSAGCSVPYPVQRLGHEVMLEFIGDRDTAAPRLVHAHATRRESQSLFDQAVENLHLMARTGVVHGDLSPYNMLVWHGRLVMIDFPQAVDPIGNPEGMTLLERDVNNVCTWFIRQGISCDPSELYASLLSEII